MLTVNNQQVVQWYESTMYEKTYIWISVGLLLIPFISSTDLRRILPMNLKIRMGEDMQLRLTRILPDNISCYVKTPLLTTYNLESTELDSSGRLSYWTENGECGLRVKNVTQLDAGAWRLTAKNDSTTIVDVTFVEVLDKVTPSDIQVAIESGLPYTLLLEENTEYCNIQQPHSEQTILVGGVCQIDLNQPTLAVQGNWIGMAGIVGQIQEVTAHVKLNVYHDKLVSGFIQDSTTNAIHAYCYLQDSEESLDFCRFSRADNDKIGFRLSEGLRNGRYSYFGAGLENGYCGMTIESPMPEDYGQWQCSVGVKDEKPFGSIIQIYSHTSGAMMARALPTELSVTHLRGKLQLRCEATVSISYCWLVAPDGTIFNPDPRSTKADAPYKYIGDGFGKGQCALEIYISEMSHDGEWICHMGPEELGFELTTAINVRISDTPLAAENRRIEVTRDESLSLQCRIVPEKISIEYCRFLMPDGTGIHISDEITENNPLILEGTRYWFSGESLHLGGCGIKVDKASSKHIGNWTCAARLLLGGNGEEALDRIAVHVIEPSVIHETNLESLTASATTGIVMGVGLLLLILVAGSLYAIKRLKAGPQMDTYSLNTVSITGTDSRRSSSSTNSNGDLIDMTVNTPTILYNSSSSHN
ncbi:uncharacterized protein LOC105691252 [Athalia rosae]|uniref:uncharacterized protein LOC105691252 n=1 Tax=Athalia rosae TaxID=37344 RepID=UPI0020338B39|nr:uncharacterized protein LOC105691252 [Athalia rosae]